MLGHYSFLLLCIADRLCELCQSPAPLQSDAPVRLRDRGFPPHLCLRGGGTEDGGTLGHLPLSLFLVLRQH